MIYFDTSYLVKLYLHERGSREVRTLAETEQPATSLHGKAELAAALHRHFREGQLSRSSFREALNQVRDEEDHVTWLAVDASVCARVQSVYLEAGPNIFLRAADALHLACAAENGFREVYSSDRQLLTAAPLFGLRPKNVIPAQR